ncbi:MAG: ribonuclease R [Clostridia bacterium]|nr:ribonuclease R [Clostridia bacterium]
MQEIIDFISAHSLDYQTRPVIARAVSDGLNMPYTDAYVSINKLLENGDMVQVGGMGKLALSKTLGYKKGKLTGNARGFAFCRILDEEAPDVFVPHVGLKNALHKDTVLISVKKKGEQFEGEVVKILARNNLNIVGRLDYVRPGLAFVKPDDVHYFNDIMVKNADKMRAQNGDKVVCRIKAYNNGDKNPFSEITEVLGHDDTPMLAMLSIIRENNLYEEFPKDVLAEAKTQPTSVPESRVKGRVDFRDDKVVTIDGEDAKDLDDAVCVIKKPDGSYILKVHIADVSDYVKYDSLLDKEAYKRATSVYFPNLVYPMLPRELSNGICSLNPNENRLTLSVVMHITSEGDVVDYDICEGVIRTCERMTYTDVFAILQGDEATCKKYDYLVQDFKNMEELHYILEAKRKKRGALEFDLPECKFEMDAEGHVIDVHLYERNVAHMMIESFMLIANEVVAEAMCKREIPFVFRVHEQPDADKMNEFFNFIYGFKLKLNTTPDKVKPKDLQNLLNKIKGQPYESMINQVMLRSLQKARYASKNLGHFGIAAQYYCHFTSPIRRYPDLAIHRIIKSVVLRKPDKNWYEFLKDWVVDASLQSSDREKLAESAEREVDDLKKAEYMQGHLQEEFEGIVTGVTSFGVFVELPNTVEGLCTMENLPDDNYLLFEKAYKLSGSKHSYHLGQKVRVKAVEVNLLKRQITFKMLTE